jgi:carbohydrate diacid regulator
MSVQAGLLTPPRPDPSTARSTAAADLLTAFLRGPNAVRAELANDAARLVGDEAESVAVIVVDGSDYVDPPDDPSSPARQRHRTGALLSAVVELISDGNDPICADLGGGEVALLKRAGAGGLPMLKLTAAALAEHLARTLRAQPRICVGLPHRGLAGVVRSYQDARAAASVNGTAGRDGIHCLDAAGLVGLLEAPSRASRRALAERILAPLADDPYLAATLEAYFAADCSPGAAAERLGLHRNTLAYRLGRVAALTGLDPRRFDDAVQLRVSMELTSARE